jgi:type I restriction enzyme S subunit
MEKQELIPQLRFPDFEGEWEEMKLGSIAKFSKGKGISKNDISEEGENECIRYGQLYTHYHELINEVISKTNIAAKNLVLSEENDVIIPASGETHIDIATASCVLKSGIALGGDLNIIKTKNNGVFLSFYLNYKKKLDIANLAQGISVVHLYSSQLASLSLNLPTLPEQQKIASFFTAIDQKTTQLKQKKDLLEKYKKGVMQKIFLQKIRFKDDNGQEFPKWEKKKLGEIAEVKRGAASQHLKYVNDESKGIRLLRINDFLSDDAVYVEDTADIKRFRVKTNDLLIAGTGATAGIIFIVPEKFNNMSFSYNAPRIRVTNAHHTFIYYYLKSDIILREQKRLFVGNAQPFLDTDVMRGFKINLPSLPEQTKIANFLSAIDDKINHTHMQIEKAEVWKKGLLQQMFV